MKNFYDTLGLTVDATQGEIEEACWKKIRNLSRQMEGRQADDRAAALREFIAAYNVLSNEANRAMYNLEIGVGAIEGAPGVVYRDEVGPTGEYEVPMGVRQKASQAFDIDEGTRLSVLRTGGGTLTFVTTTSDQVVIKGNPPPFAEIREGELMIAASDYNAELSLPDRIGYELVVRSHRGRLSGVIIHEGTIESQDTEIELELGGGLDLDLSRSRDIEPAVSGMELVDSGLYLAPHQSGSGRTLIVKASGGSVKMRYSRLEFL